MMRRTLFALAALCLAGRAAAQDGSEGSVQRTPENAQKFLSAMAEQHKLRISATHFAVMVGQSDTSLSYAPVRITSNGRCTTEFSGPVSDFSTNYLSEHMGGPVKPDPAEVLARHKAEVERRGVPLGPYTLDWSHVTEITKRYTTSIRIVANGTPFLLETPSPEIEARVRLAMETLKTACDKTEGLGF